MKVVINFDKRYVYGIFVLMVLVIGVVGVYAGVDTTKAYHNASQIEMADGQSLQEVMDSLSASSVKINGVTMGIQDAIDNGNIVTAYTKSGSDPTCNTGDEILSKYWKQESFGDKSYSLYWCANAGGWDGDSCTITYVNGNHPPAGCIGPDPVGYNSVKCHASHWTKIRCRTTYNKD